MSTLCTAYPSFPRKGKIPLNTLKKRAKTAAIINVQEVIPIDELRPSWKSHLDFYAFSSRPPTTIDFPGARATVVQGINTAGQLVGFFEHTTGTHGFVATPCEPDTIRPVINVSANPATLSPPNGRQVTVTVSGMITDEPGDCGVSSAAYQVMDEYGQIQPSGSVTLEADGRYAFTVALQASRRGNDQDGRQYLIAVSAKDITSNLGVASATVAVPRN